MTRGGYESWFVSARDPASPRALWIRHTRLRSGAGPESVALWCTVVDHAVSQQPVLVKQAFGSFPAGAAAGPGQFRGAAAMAGQNARWDLAVTGAQPALRPLRPAMLYRTPLPRTKLVVSVPDGLVTGLMEVDGRRVGVDRWRGTVGHNWGTEHADCWVWLHAAGFSAAPRGGLRVVRHAAVATVELRVRRQGHSELTMGGTCGAYEYGTSQHPQGIVPRPLPDG
jgi:hypothetical protein